MRKKLAAVATAIILGITPFATSQAAPFMLQKSLPVENGLVQKVDGCHAYFDYHYVPRLGRRAEHRHRGNNCIPVVVDDGGDSYNHCHANAQSHTHSGFGRTVHRHRGNSCRVKVLDRATGSTRGRNCLTIGPITYCE